MTPRQSIATVIVLGLITVELLVLSILTLFPYLPDPGLAVLNASIYTFLAPLSLVFLLGLLYSWLFRLGMRQAIYRSTKLNSLVSFLSEPFQKMVSSTKTRSLSESAGSLKILSHSRL